MIHLHLPEEEVPSLEATFRTTSDRRLRDRLQIILMVHCRTPHGQIATDLGVSRRTIPRWLNAYLDDGLDALLPHKAKGAALHGMPDSALFLKGICERNPVPAWCEHRAGSRGLVLPMPARQVKLR